MVTEGEPGESAGAPDLHLETSEEGESLIVDLPKSIAAEISKTHPSVHERLETWARGLINRANAKKGNANLPKEEADRMMSEANDAMYSLIGDNWIKDESVQNALYFIYKEHDDILKG